MHILVALFPGGPTRIFVAKGELVHHGADRDPFLRLFRVGFGARPGDSLNRGEHLVHLFMVHLATYGLCGPNHIDTVWVMLQKFGPHHVVLLLDL